MTAGVIDTRNFAISYEETRRRLRLLEQQMSNPDIQVGSSGGGTAEFDELIITNPGAGDDIILGFLVSTPTGLGAITSTYLEEVYIDASWSGSSTSVEYEIELARRTSPGVYDQARVYRTAGTSVRLIVPVGGVVYGLRVASVNSVGIRSAFTARIDVTTAVDSTIPGTVGGLSTTVGLNSIVVTFNRLTDADMQNGDGIYRIQLSSNDFGAILADKYTSSNVEVFTGLTQGTNYKVRVAGIDPSGNQGPYTTSSNIAPGYITNSHIVADTISGDRISAGTITGAKITAGSVDGDRITANTLDANRIKTSSLTAADINISGGSLTAGTPVTGDGALLNSQGFKLYKDGEITVNMDALTGDATFTGDLVGAVMHGGEIRSANIIGEGITAANIVPNGHFNDSITGWTHLTGPGGYGLYERVISPTEPLNSDVGQEPYVKLYQSGAGVGVSGHSYLQSNNITCDAGEAYYSSLKYRIHANITASTGSSSVAGGQYIVKVIFRTAADVYNGEKTYLIHQLGVLQDIDDDVAVGDFKVPLNTAFFYILISAEFLEEGYFEIDDLYIAKAPQISGLTFSSRAEGLPTINISTVISSGKGTHAIDFEQGYDEIVDIANHARITSTTWGHAYSVDKSNNFHILEIHSGNYVGRSGAKIELRSASPDTVYNFLSSISATAGTIFISASTSSPSHVATVSLNQGRVQLTGIGGTTPGLTFNGSEVVVSSLETSITSWLNNWNNFDPGAGGHQDVRYSKVGTKVFLEGTVQAPNPITSTHAFTLAAGHWPLRVAQRPCRASGSTDPVVNVEPDGDVHFHNIANGAAVSFGIWFSTT